MVEYQINKEMATAKSDLVLTANKGESLPQLQKEGLKIIDYLAFQIAFLLWKIQKLQYIGVFDDILSTLYLLTFGSQCDNALLVFTETKRWKSILLRCSLNSRTLQFSFAHCAA